MSDSLDYWPFDYICYVKEILPALSLAMQGQTTRLQQLIETGKQRDLSFRPPWAQSRGASSCEPPPADVFFALLEEDSHFVFDSGNFTWETIERLIPLLRGHRFGEIFPLGAEVHLALMYAFCSAPLPGSSWLYSTGGDENIQLWRDYFEHNEAWHSLWEQFYQPLPAEAATVSFPAIYNDAYPRGLNPFGDTRSRVTIEGFLTPEETQRLARELPLRRKPVLSFLWYSAAREYGMHQWEEHILLSMEDFQEKKRQFYQESQKLRKHFWKAGPAGEVPEELFNALFESTQSFHLSQKEQAFKERSPSAFYVSKAEKLLKVHLFGREPGSRLMDMERFSSFCFRKPEREEDCFFLVPEEVYHEMDNNIHTLVAQLIEAYPEETDKLHQLLWSGFWQSEDELMRRFDYAISREWGLLMYYTSGK